MPKLFDLFCQILTNSDEDLVVNAGATGANGALLVKNLGTNPKMAERKSVVNSQNKKVSLWP